MLYSVFDLMYFNPVGSFLCVIESFTKYMLTSSGHKYYCTDDTPPSTPIKPNYK